MMIVTPPTYTDFLGWASQATSQVVTVKDVFAYWVEVYVLPSVVVLKVAMLAWHKAMTHGSWEETLQRFALLVMLLAAHVMAVQFWVNPFPGSSYTLPGAVNVTANALENAVTQGSIDQLLSDVQGHQAGVGQPKEENVSGMFSYYIFRTIMVGFEIVIFGVMMLSFGGFAVGVAVGPIAIPLALFNTTAGWFNRWLGALVKFAMMRVVAAVVLAIITHVVHFLFRAIPWYLYILDLEDVFIFLVAVMAACLYFTFKIPTLTAEYFGGGEGVGGLGNWIAGTVGRIVSFASMM
jgi:type IV secretion system protein VirB6